MNESDIQKIIMKEVSSLGHTVFRNNVGVLKDYRGVPIKFGLCVGSSDLIGWTKDGKFLAVEVKTTKGRVSKAQENFINAVNKSGGIGFVARRKEDVKKFLTDLS